MSTYHILNFGCRATLADAAAIEAGLRERGMSRALPAQADVVVVNTCTVTSDADAVARQAIRAAHRANPAARVVVTGCYAQRAPEELAVIEGVSLVVGNSHQTELPAVVAQALLPVTRREIPHASPFVQIQNSLARVPAALPQAGVPGPLKIHAGDISAHKEFPVGQDVPPVRNGALETDRTRPVLKIQDGCNNRCAYCILPFVRGRSRSLPPPQVVEAVNRLCAGGAKEIVLSGINMGSYGRDLTPRADFGDLLRRILEETPLERLRLSSVEPMDITQDLVDLVASSGGHIARHFHVPLQSGSDRVLKAMHRWYRAAHYARRIELIRERIPGAAIGADVIVGFPGEMDEDHRATLGLLERLPLAYLHVFAFSARPGTEAARRMEEESVGEVSPRVIKQRSRELRAVGAAKSAAFRAAQDGEMLRLLTLNRRGECGSGVWTAALSDNYLTVRLPGALPRNELFLARISSQGDALCGTLIS
jgi:threonylcarbamoyladenosine tRNA methylthiotransferase MtaB